MTSETVETIGVKRLPGGNIQESIQVKHPDHEPGTYGFGASKAQHFIQHIRDVDVTQPGWRDKQEEHAENAQMAICEELECPVCQNNCKLLTTHHWDTNRILQGKEPHSDNFIQVQRMLCEALKPVMNE